MSTGTLQSLTLGEAVEYYESMDLSPRPATLHPRYVAADASRNAGLHPLYLGFEMQGRRWMHSLHLSVVTGTDLRDASSPYGYGGPLSSSDDPDFVAAAWHAYVQWMASQRVVVEYVRFHPALVNERFYGGTVTHNRAVVWMDLAADDITAAYAKRLRGALAKGRRAGLVYREHPFASCAEQFGAFYRQAMAQIGADPFYFFDDAYFRQLANCGFAALGVCQHDGAVGDHWLAACLFLDGKGLREYHLSATSAEGRGVAAPALALHEAALAARRAGARRMYLGGGTDAGADNPLLFFKSAFSADRLTYRTGSHVFRSGDYAALKQLFPFEWSAHPERPIFYRKV